MVKKLFNAKIKKLIVRMVQVPIFVRKVILAHFAKPVTIKAVYGIGIKAVLALLTV